MIGKVTLPGGGEAVLTDAGVWEHPHAAVADHLNVAFDPREATGVAAVLPFGEGAVGAAAAALGGAAAFPRPLPPLPEGAVS